mgnify:CR=1 FL=1
MTRARSIADIGDDVAAGGSLVTTESPSLGRRNLIINGAMQVAQRGTSFNIAHDGDREAFPVDRFKFIMDTAMDSYDATVEQSSDAPDGFANSFKITTGTAETGVDAEEYILVEHKVEAQNLQQLNYGSASAQLTTFSFWVKSSVTGTFGMSVYVPDSGRIIGKQYTINSADTWEYKTITVEGDTSGSGIANDNGEGVRIAWWLLAGSDFTGTDNTDWVDFVTTAYGDAVEQNGVGTTAGATWQITGVQLEVGSVATPFEHRSYGEELAACQRYYFQNGPLIGFWTASNEFRQSICFPVAMRTGPELAIIDSNGYHELLNTSGYNGVSSINFFAVTTVGADIRIVSSADRGRSLGNPCKLGENVISLSAEL